MADISDEKTSPEKPVEKSCEVKIAAGNVDYNEELSKEAECSEDLSQSLSKNQQKKIRRLARKLEHRPGQRQLERQKQKEKKRKAIESGTYLPPDRKRLRKEGKEACSIRVVIDASYDEYMTEDESKKLLKQIQHCYAINRRAEQPFKYSITSFTGQTADRLHGLEGTSSWQIEYEKKPYNELYAAEKIVFLSAESTNTLEKLEEEAVYVIGGLVDHNRHKGLCHRLAEEKNIKTAKLPITDYIDMKCRRVLTVDHVFDILVRFKELQDWEAAFVQVIPKRKGAQTLHTGKRAEEPTDDACTKSEPGA